MTALSAEQNALVAAVSKEWIGYRAERIGAEARIRALVSDEVGKSVAAARDRVSAAIVVALAASVPKVRLKEVTTKDRLSFDALIPVPEQIAAGAILATTIRLEWDGDLIALWVDPTSRPDSAEDPTDARPWTTLLEFWERPSDGKQFVNLHDATVPYPNGIAAADWLHREPTAAPQVLDWVAKNPRR